MIIWINGPFGSGKSTLAAVLKAIVADSLVVDLKELGAFIRTADRASRVAGGGAERAVKVVMQS